jgi:hypothetical protein
MVGQDPAAMMAGGGKAMLQRWFMTLMVRTSNPEAPASLGTYTANVQQILHTMNINSPLWSGIRPMGSGTLDRLLLLVDSPEIVLTELYLCTLGRRPTEKELARAKDHIERRGKDRALEDLFWAILNTDEFIFNH